MGRLPRQTPQLCIQPYWDFGARPDFHRDIAIVNSPSPECRKALSRP